MARIGEIRKDGKKEWKLEACMRCGGSGIYSDYHGECYRCGGIGYTDKDWHRIDETAVKNRERAAKRREEKRLEKEAKNRAIVADRLRELGVLDKVSALFYEDDLGGAVVGYNVLPVYMETIDEAKDGWNHESMLREDVRRFIGDVVDDLTEFDLNKIDRDVWTIIDIVRNMATFGKVSEKAENFLIALVERLGTIEETAEKRRHERALKDEAYNAAENVPTGKVAITGEILSVKFKDDGFGGGTLKCLVLDDRGFKVWGSVPKKVLDAVSGGCVGVRFTCMATVEPSNDDPKFGFYKRPSKVEVL